MLAILSTKRQPKLDEYLCLDKPGAKLYLILSDKVQTSWYWKIVYTVFSNRLRLTLHINI